MRSPRQHSREWVRGVAVAPQFSELGGVAGVASKRPFRGAVLEFWPRLGRQIPSTEAGYEFVSVVFSRKALHHVVNFVALEPVTAHAEGQALVPIEVQPRDAATRCRSCSCSTRPYGRPSGSAARPHFAMKGAQHRGRPSPLGKRRRENCSRSGQRGNARRAGTIGVHQTVSPS
jgi:hypothetical protein